MLKSIKFFFVFSFLLTTFHLFADPRACLGNDTVVALEKDLTDLMTYLKGTWSVSGSWLVVEGQGKIKKSIKTRMTGVETFTPILNGHFMQKNLNAKVKYFSRDLDKSIQNSFSAMTLFTFNENVGKYFYWFYDCTGSFLEANGIFNYEKNQYVFSSQYLNNDGKKIDSQYTITIIDSDHYRWEMQTKPSTKNTWEPGASGLSTRKKS